MAGALGTSWPSSVSAGLIKGSHPTCCLGPDSFVFVPSPCTPVALLSCDALDPAAPPPLPGGSRSPLDPPLRFGSLPMGRGHGGRVELDSSAHRGAEADPLGIDAL